MKVYIVLSLFFISNISSLLLRSRNKAQLKKGVFADQSQKGGVGFGWGGDWGVGSGVFADQKGADQKGGIIDGGVGLGWGVGSGVFADQKGAVQKGGIIDGGVGLGWGVGSGVFADQKGIK